jgi:transcriptional regulator with XRE-family HTH domain
MPDKTLEDLASSLAMVLLRYSEGLEQREVAGAVDITPSQASAYEHGARPVPRETLEQVAALVDVPVDLLELTLRMIRSFLLAKRGRSRADRALADEFAVELVALIYRAADLILAPSRRQREEVAARPRSEERAEAVELLAYLKRCTPAERRLLVEESREYRSWAVCEGAALESVALARNQPREALEWARLAVKIARRVPGDESWRWRLEGWALAFLSNALRACNQLFAAEGALIRARRLWQAGAAADPGLLPEAWLPWIEASLHRDQRRFTDALEKTEAALSLDRGELRGQILLSKSALLHVHGDAEGSTAALLEAEPLIDPAREPGLAYGLRFNLLVNLLDLGRVEEAEPWLPEMETLAERLGEKLGLQRLRWLTGKVHAQRGRFPEALAAFAEVRRTFAALNLTFDYALVSLDLALVLLELGRTTEVRSVAEETLAIFEAQGVHTAALAAVRIFCEAAKRETATGELTRQVARFLQRARLDPELRFEDESA